jgi:hypothetical protein
MKGILDLLGPLENFQFLCLPSNCFVRIIFGKNSLYIPSVKQSKFTIVQKIHGPYLQDKVKVQRETDWNTDGNNHDQRAIRVVKVDLSLFLTN